MPRSGMMRMLEIASPIPTHLSSARSPPMSARADSKANVRHEKEELDRNELLRAFLRAGGEDPVAAGQIIVAADITQQATTLDSWNGCLLKRPRRSITRASSNHWRS